MRDKEFDSKWIETFGCDVHPVVKRLITSAVKCEEIPNLDDVLWEINDKGICFSVCIESIPEEILERDEALRFPSYPWRMTFPVFVTNFDASPDTEGTEFIGLSTNGTVMLLNNFDSSISLASPIFPCCFLRVVISDDGVTVQYNFKNKEKSTC